MLKLVVFSLFACWIAFSSSESLKKRYLLYDVNPGEGFNLRRDVFMRIAVLTRKLNIQDKTTQYILVLPPWGNLYHWQSRDIGVQSRLPWSLFFDTASISNFVPVIELAEFLSIEGNIINSVYYLQGYEGGWKDGKFEEKFDILKCLDPPQYRKDHSGRWKGYFWDFQDIRADKFECMSLQGTTDVLNKFLINSDDKSIMVDRAETLLHSYFGDENYWGVRRSMRFAQHLVNIADQYRMSVLKSNDPQDNTTKNEDWREHRVERSERGGPYICVHLRRKDYVRARPDQIPNIAGAAEQLRKLLNEQKLNKLFVSTDAPMHEFQDLRENLPEFEVNKYIPPADVKQAYKDGGVAIIDQIICSHAKYFIGSYESTFTFRIQEEREIMGFPVKNTFDMLCRNPGEKCEKGSKWLVNWGPPNKDWTLNKNSLDHSEL